ncbi:MAG TPA: response regulator [Opitutaceae bacterium]|jgi:two-component system KDP operon response regulator KdpE|nr:response regulator [Opitutaceae bacterium]
MTKIHRPKVLVIDDEIQIRRLLRVTLESGGYDVHEAETGQLGLTEAAGVRPEGIVLDLGLPDLDGKEVLRRLREWSQTPVLVLTVRDSERETIAALDAGADDYLTKPFRGLELLARLRAVLRRTQPANAEAVVRFGAVEIDFVAHLVRRDGKEVKLSAKEYDLLRYLALHRGRVVTHRQILRELWGANAEENTHYLWVYTTHLRQKLEDNPHEPKYLKTEAGIGYRLDVEG